MSNPGSPQDPSQQPWSAGGPAGYPPSAPPQGPAGWPQQPPPPPGPPPGPPPAGPPTGGMYPPQGGYQGGPPGYPPGQVWVPQKPSMTKEATETPWMAAGWAILIGLALTILGDFVNMLQHGPGKGLISTKDRFGRLFDWGSIEWGFALLLVVVIVVVGLRIKGEARPSGLGATLVQAVFFAALAVGAAAIIELIIAFTYVGGKLQDASGLGHQLPGIDQAFYNVLIRLAAIPVVGAVALWARDIKGVTPRPPQQPQGPPQQPQGPPQGYGPPPGGYPQQ